jgi:U4/U6.U5 tri-snRNP-associated protein 2
MFMNADSGRVYCLPDMYEVQDRSLGDIQYILNPTFTGGCQATVGN